MKAFFLGVLTTVVVAATVFVTYKPKATIDYQPSQMVTALRNILKLGILEINLNQMYKIDRDNLTVGLFTIPFTYQKSMVLVTGNALLGYDLDKISVTVEGTSKTMNVTLPAASLLSIDTDFQFIGDHDTFLNRISRDDRNKMMQDLKMFVRKDLLSHPYQKQLEKRTKTIIDDFSAWSGYTIQHQIAALKNGTSKN